MRHISFFFDRILFGARSTHVLCSRHNNPCKQSVPRFPPLYTIFIRFLWNTLYKQSARLLFNKIIVSFLLAFQLLILTMSLPPDCDNHVLDFLSWPCCLHLLNKPFTILESSLFNFANYPIAHGKKVKGYLDNSFHNASSTNLWRSQNCVWVIIAKAAND